MSEKRILLVEDNPDDVALTQRSLKRNNITNEVVIVKNGVEALDYLLGVPVRELPVVVLLDIKLPKMDGLEVLKRLRSEDRTKLLPVVILTSSKEECDILNGYMLGANSYVRKPVDFDQFNEAIKHLGLYWLLLNEAPPPKEG